MLRWILSAFVAICLGCGAPARADAPPTLPSPSPPDAPAGLGGSLERPVIAYVYQSLEATIEDMTPGKAAFMSVAGGLTAVTGLTPGPILGGGGGIELGPDRAGDEVLANPANFLAQRLAESLVAVRGYRMAEAPVENDDGRYLTWKDVRVPVSEATGIAYVVDVAPAQMALQYRGLDFDHYDFRFVEKVKLVDLGANKVLQSASCLVVPTKDLPPPTRKMLMGDDARALKTLVRMATEQCLEELDASLKLPPAPSRPVITTVAAPAPIDPALRRREDMVALAYALGQMHALHAVCEGEHDQYWRARMSKLLTRETGDAVFTHLLTVSFNSGYSAASQSFPSCNESIRGEELRVSVRMAAFDQPGQL